MWWMVVVAAWSWPVFQNGPDHEGAAHPASGGVMGGAPSVWSYALPGRGSYPVAADVDGDGLPEVVVGTRSATVEVLDYQKGMGFSLRQSIPVSDQVRTAPAVRDVDGDGVPEIVVATRSGLEILDGRSGALEARDLAVGRLESAITLADVDGDGRVDVFVGSRNLGLVRFVWDGVTLQRMDYGPVGMRVKTAPAVGDVDGDGQMEVVFGDDGRPGSVHVLDARTGAVEQTFPTGHRTDRAPGVTLADLDGNGTRDILLPVSDKNATPSALVLVWRYTGGAWVSDTVDTLQGGVEIRTGVSVGDVDADGWVEMAVGTDGGELQVYRWEPPGTYVLLLQVPVGAVQRIRAPIVLADMNVDTANANGPLPDTVDLVVEDGNGAVGIFRGTDGSVINYVLIALGGGNLEGVVLADLTGEGNLEMVVVDRAGNLYAVEGDAGVVSTPESGSGSPAGIRWHVRPGGLVLEGYGRVVILAPSGRIHRRQKVSGRVDLGLSPGIYTLLTPVRPVRVVVP